MDPWTCWEGALGDFCDKRLTQNGLRGWDDFWMAIYQWSMRRCHERHPHHWWED